eukprot:Anaeramoba_ignava/a90738_68.p1 GENE.a90738_68~~a90738_68.p1  ORF type:complete len:1130 (-),score=262.25 a90738_68:50-3439(-)
MQFFKNQNWFFKILIILFLLTYETKAQIYVSTNGNDQNDCLSIDFPCKTLKEGITKASEGFTILINNGTYSSPNDNQLTLTKSLIFTAKNPAFKPIIDCNHNWWMKTEFPGSSGSLTIQNTILRNCKANTSISTILAPVIHATNTNITIDSCEIYGNSIEITNENSSATYSGAIYIENAQEIEIISSLFQSNNNSFNGAGSVYIVEDTTTSNSEMRINGNQFISNIGDIGAIYLQINQVQTAVSLYLENTSFINNNGKTYGAFYIEDNLKNKQLNTEFVDNYFSKNSAEFNGAMGIRHSQSTIFSTSFTNNTFFMNKGSTRTAALSIVFNKLQKVTYQFDSNNFTYNEGFYGAASFQMISTIEQSYSTSVNEDVLVFQQNVFENNNGKLGGSLYFDIRNCNITFSKNQFSNNTAIQGGAIFLTGDGNFFDDGSVYDGNSGEIVSTIFSRITKIFQMNNIVIKTDQNDTIFMEILTDDSSLISTSLKLLQCPIENNWEAKEETHFQFEKQLVFECKRCPIDTYNFATGLESLETEPCFDCPLGGICLGGSDVRANSDYWGVQTDYQGSLKFYFCPFGYCTVKKEEDLHLYKECGNNREGILCGKCKDGYTETLNPSGECVEKTKCSSDSGVYIALALPKALFYAIILLYIPQMKTAHFHIFMHFFQVLMIVLPSIVENPFVALGEILDSFSALFNLQTNLAIFGDAGACPAKSLNAVQKILMQLIGPIVFILAIIFVFLLIKLIQLLRGKNSKNLENENENENKQLDFGDKDKLIEDQEKDKDNNTIPDQKLISDSEIAKWQRAEQQISENVIPPDSQNKNIDNNPDSDTSSLPTLANDEDLSDLADVDIKDINIDKLMKIYPELQKLNLSSEDEGGFGELIERLKEQRDMKGPPYPSYSLGKRLLVGLLTLGIMSHFIILKTLLELTYCIKIKFASGEELRMFRDGEIKCYTTGQIIAIIFTIIVCAFPLVLFFILKKFKKSRRVFTILSPLYFPFKDKYYWYSALMIGWRIALIVVFILINEPVLKAYIVSTFCLLIALIHFQTKPFVSNFHNFLQTVSLMALTFFSSLTVIQAGWSYGGVSLLKQPTKDVNNGLTYFVYALGALSSFYALIIFFYMLFRNIFLEKCK